MKVNFGIRLTIGVIAILKVDGQTATKLAIVAEGCALPVARAGIFDGCRPFAFCRTLTSC